MQIHGDNFTLRGWFPEDAAALLKYADNPNIAACLLDRFPHPYTLQDANNWISRLQDQNPLKNFAIAINGEVAGGIGLEFRTDIYHKTPLLGYWLAECYWGKGIMPKAVKLVSDYAFKQLDVICILAYVFSKNPNSMRVLEKAGYQQQGIIKRSVIKNGEILDEHIYACNGITL